MSQVILFNRKKEKGKNSIEEVFSSLKSYLCVEKIYEMPKKGTSILSNLRFAYRKKGYVNHISGDVHYIALATGKRTVLTIHDIESTLKDGNLATKLIKKLIWFWIPCLIVKKITVISEFTKKQLIKLVPFSRHKIVVIHNPYNELIEFKAKGFDKEKPVILHVGTKTNKNLFRVIKSLEGIPCKLLIIGRLSVDLLRELQAHNIEYESSFDVSFDEIVEAYKKCDIVSFPSIYEGFGMPILEAHKAGRVVITSNVCSMPEIAGDAACYVNPFDIESIRAGFLKIIQDDIYRDELVAKGFQNLERFSPQQISKRYNDLYKQL
ncbi:Glycosyltransferase involved in cell wall bisynthesis [Parapedobacter composti]|uniref:Glycosyltransferase involved in cell wall bisynthesis n=1 Tax=Parapedobacter composti TaxID=623281 RepID=A0A1I1J0C1_9SPHI|nr:glycosyltransferase family 1 protein [Parapedobacter composti]SFC38910.1 Glycosyltransferase involved in cell wall bisynthesis [Parapedobacter composti]